MWYLVLCVMAAGADADICLPMQQMASREQCEAVAQHYKEIAHGVRYHCFTLETPKP